MFNVLGLLLHRWSSSVWMSLMSAPVVSVIINVSGIYDTSVYSYILIYPMIKFHKKIILVFAYKFSLYSETAF